MTKFDDLTDEEYSLIMKQISKEANAHLMELIEKEFTDEKDVIKVYNRIVLNTFARTISIKAKRLGNTSGDVDEQGLIFLYMSDLFKETMNYLAKDKEAPQPA